MVTYTQDTNGNLTNVSGPYGNFVYGQGPVGYSSIGLSSMQNPRLNTWTFGFYTDFRAQTVTFPPNGNGGGPTTTGYVYSPPDTTPKGWMKTVSTDANNHGTYIASYPAQAVKTTDALTHSRSASYTANDDIQMATDAMSPGNNTTFTYDALNNPTTEAKPTGATNYLAYSNGAPMSPGVTCSSTDSSHPYLAKCSEDAQGHQSTYTYDGPGNRLAPRCNPTPGTGWNTTPTATTTFISIRHPPSAVGPHRWTPPNRRSSPSTRLSSKAHVLWPGRRRANIHGSLGPARLAR
ncbi:MAG: hypothetical protein M3083_24830 [Actinomycetota bacterium]|nr:hypothetical protein [Actinomycetota bacterium]